MNLKMVGVRSSGVGMRLLALLTLLTLLCLGGAACGTASTVGPGGAAAGPVPTAAVDWDVDKLTIAEGTRMSDLIVWGKVVGLDEPRWNSPQGKEWSSHGDSSALVYETFYVEPAEILKGTPQWGTPVAFRVWTNTTQGRPALAVGDSVVAFGMIDAKRYGTEGVYRPAEAYWLTSSNNSLWVKQERFYKNQGHTKDPAEASISIEELKNRVLVLVTTTTAAGTQSQALPPTTAQTDRRLSDADMYAASNLLHDQFFPALQKGDVRGVRALLVDDRKADADKLCADAAVWQQERGPEAAWGGSTGLFASTGQSYSWDATTPVPEDLGGWMRQHPEKRLGLQVFMGDNALWWFGMERTADGSWLVWPGQRDEQYAASHTLAGLATLKIEAAPRPGVHATIKLQQLPDSGAVSADLVAQNASSTVFTLQPSDLTLEVDGAPAHVVLMPDSGACWRYSRAGRSARGMGGAGGSSIPPRVPPGSLIPPATRRATNTPGSRKPRTRPRRSGRRSTPSWSTVPSGGAGSANSASEGGRDGEFLNAFRSVFKSSSAHLAARF